MSVMRRTNATAAAKAARSESPRRARPRAVARPPGPTRRGRSGNALAASEERDASSARKAILDATVEALEHKGESTIRISEIARKAGVAVGLIYYHFADREGLVSAAQIERMLRTPVDDVNLLDATVRLTDDPGQFASMIARILCTAISADRAAQRLDRVAILGASKGRPAFTASLGRAISAQTDRLAEIVAASRDRGMVDPAVDVRAFAILVQAMSIGLVIADLDEKPTDRRRLLDVFLRSLVGFAGPAASKVVVKSPLGQGRRKVAPATRRGR